MARGHGNLIPFNKRTEEEQRNIASMGGKKSGEARHRKKTIREALVWYLDSKIHPSNKTEEHLLQKFPGLTHRDYVAIAAIEAASRSNDVAAMIFARDTMGEMPTKKIKAEESKSFEIRINMIE